MKSLTRLLLVSFVFGCWTAMNPVFGTHQMGLDMTYECLSACTYRIYVTTYYDCTGSAMNQYLPLPGTPPPNPDADVNAEFRIEGIGTACTVPTPVGGWVQDANYGYIEVTPICPVAGGTGCTNGTSGINGVVSVRWYRDYNFCPTNPTCTEFRLVYDGCCRNGGITSGAANDGINSRQTIINTALANCNTSPVFSNPPVPYLCAGQSFTFNQGAFDADGDSLVYSLGTCFDDEPFGGGVPPPVGYNPGFSALQPLGAGWNVSINSQTGDITMNPSPNGPVQVGVICVIVEEYRNGVKIGEIVRDMQITVINCGTANTLPSVPQLTNVTPPSATVNGFVIDAFACQELCFDIPLVDPDMNQNKIIFWNQGIPGATLSNANTGVVGDTISAVGGLNPTGRFCWIPDSSGVYSFLLTVQDDGCPIFGQNQYTIVINVQTGTLDPSASLNRIDCNTVELIGIPCGGNGPFTFSWVGDGGLSGVGENLIHAYPDTGNYEFTLTITDASGIQTMVTDTVRLTNTSQANAGTDQIVCSGQIGNIGTPAVPGYSYSWDSPLGQGWAGPGNPSVAQPDITFNNGTTNPVVLEYYLTAFDDVGCPAYDTVKATFRPAILSDFIIDPPVSTICEEDTVTVTYQSPPPPGAIYNWDFDGGFSTNVGPGPHRVTWNTPGTKFIRLSVGDGTCISDTTTQTMEVNPIPTSSFNLADTVCVDEFTNLVYTGSATSGATYTWDLGNANPSSVSGPGPHFIQWNSTGFQQVSLTVEENGCVSTTETQTVLVVPQPIASFTLDDSICAGALMTIIYNGPSGPNASYSWNFGDAVVLSGAGRGPYQVFWQTPGSKSVCLQVGEGDCLSPVVCRDVEVTGRPVVQINPVADQCFPNNSFNFSTVGGPATVYEWDFGPSAVPATFQGTTPPAVTYQSPGSKTVRLVVFGNGCQSTDTATVSFEVVDEPSADFSVSSGSICSDETVNFTYNGPFLGVTQTFFWDFGPGAIPQSSTQRNPGVVRYTSGGTRTVSLTVGFGPCVVTTTQTVDVNEAPTVNAGLDREFCEGDGGVELDASVFGGSGVYFYSWSCDRGSNCGFDSVNVEDPKVNPDVQNPTEQVEYYFQVTDANGCVSNLDTVIVTVKAKPRLNAGRDLTMCAPDEPGLFLQGRIADDNRAPQPIAYQWTPSTGLSNPNVLNPFARPDSTTIYTLTGVSANGCSSQATTVDSLSSMVVRVSAKPMAEAGLDTGLCIGESVRLDGFASGAGPDYTYTWTASPSGSLNNPSSPNPIASPTQTTVYTLVVSSNECSSDGDTVRVQVDTKPTINPGNSLSACLFEEVALDARASGDPRSGTYTYQWSPGRWLNDSTLANPIALPEQTQTYSVFAQSAFGCVSDTQAITITLKPTPEVNLLAQDTALCSDDSLTLRAQHSFRTAPGGPVNYRWYPGDLIAERVNEDEVKFKPTRSGYLIVETVISSGDCPTRDSIFVNVSPAVVVTAEADTSRICEGESTQLFAEGGQGNAMYSWSPATGLSDPTIANPIANPSVSTDYVVTVSEGICAKSETVSIEVNPGPGADYFNSLPSGCGTLEVSFMENASGPAVSYEWDFGDGSAVSNEANPTHVYEQPGSYVVTFTAVSAGGCAESVSQSVIEVKGEPEATVSGIPVAGERLPIGSTIELSAPGTEITSWLWSFGDGGSATGETVRYRYEEVGTYFVEVTVTDEQGCSRTISYGPYEIYQPEVKLQNVFTPNGDGNNDVFRIEYTGLGDYEIVVYDRWGRELFLSQNPNEGWNGTLGEGSQAHAGVYLYTAKIGTQTYKGTVTLLR